MSKRKDYRIIQIGFPTKKEYEKYHSEAVNYHGTDNRLADVAYARECIKTCRKTNRASMKEKAIALVKGQTALTEVMRKMEGAVKEDMINAAKETIKLWVY